MSSINHILKTFSFFLVISWAENAEKCDKTSDCSCEFKDKGSIDLHGIETENSEPKFHSVPGEDGNLYFYNPCADFSLTRNCRNSAACVYDQKLSEYKSLGMVESANFDSDGSGNVMIVYNIVGKEALITTDVHLICNENKDSQLLPHGSSNNGTLYNFTLTSPCACVNGCFRSRGLSTGSVLLILTACLIVLYLCIGIIYNRSLGARGWYLIPHHDFWTDLPYLIRDGYWYFISPCVGDRVEYRYYERL